MLESAGLLCWCAATVYFILLIAILQYGTEMIHAKIVSCVEKNSAHRRIVKMPLTFHWSTFIFQDFSLSLSFVRKLIDIEFVETWFGPTVWLHTLHASTLVLLGCASLCRWDGCFWADAVHHNDITAVTNLLSSRVSSQLSEGFVVFACPNSFRSDVPFHVVRKCILESALKCGKKQRRGIERMEARLRNEVSKMNRM